MKRMLCLSACLILTGATAFAEHDEEFEKWMKSTQMTVGSLRKNLMAKSGDAASADAKKLQEIFTQVHGFWQKKNTEDAMKFSMDANAGFKEVGEMATAGKFEDAEASLKKTMANCQGCHTAHREKAADGTWTIK